MITVNNLTFTYGKEQPPALKSLNLVINEGEYLALIGPNGCGKTTLIKHFNALFFPTAGEVRIDGLCTRDPHHLLEIRRRVGMIFQNPDNQIVGMSVEEDVAFGPGNLGLPSAEVRRRVDRALETVGLTGLETRPPHTLSGGQKQLLALAGLLAMDPAYIILDEPTSSLDPAGKENVLALLRRLQGQGIGVMHVTHSMDEAAVADRVLVLNRGELSADGSPGEVLSQVDWLRSLGLAPPRMAELMWRLRQMGVDVNSSIFTTDEAAAEITALLKRLEVSPPRRLSWKAGEHV